MSRSIVCYPQPGKASSRRLCEAFAAGSGGAVQMSVSALEPGAAAFHGVVGIEHLYRQARAEREWFYIDNAYFDRHRKAFYRVGHNALQGVAGKPDWVRFAKLELGIQPWKRDGRHVLVVVQSPHFMREVALWPGGVDAWQKEVLQRLHRHTDRPIVVRHWSRDKSTLARTLAEDLKGAWALVTHMSAAANEALVAGVPVFVTGPCAALPMGLSQLESIEYPRRPDGRFEWAAGLAAMQWTVEEIRAGVAWRALSA